jgi:transcriptional regulator with XRE-family HTH domain
MEVKAPLGQAMTYKRVRELREDKDIKQKTMAEYLQVTQNAYSKYELGHRGLSAEVLCKVADYHNVSVDYLLGRTDVKDTLPKGKNYNPENFKKKSI